YGNKCKKAAAFLADRHRHRFDSSNPILVEDRRAARNVSSVDSVSGHDLSKNKLPAVPEIYRAAIGFGKCRRALVLSSGICSGDRRTLPGAISHQSPVSSARSHTCFPHHLGRAFLPPSDYSIGLHPSRNGTATIFSPYSIQLVNRMRRDRQLS